MLITVNLTGPAAANSRTIGYYPMDEASGNFVNAVFPTAYLLRNGTVSQQVEASGLILARTINDTVDAIIGNSADGIVLTGNEPWCIHGFFRWRNDHNSNQAVRGGGNPSPWGGGPTFQQVSGGAGGLRLTTYDGVDGLTARTTNISPGAGNELRYVAFGWDGTNAFIKLTTDGTTWTSATTAMSGQQMEGPPIKFEIGDFGAEIDVGQVRITRDIPSEADLTWFANGMVGRATADVLGRIGTWPALQELPATVQTDGGTTWSGTTNTSLTGFITSADTGTSTYWTRPYYLRGMDAALADTHGDYVWLNSSDHVTGASSGISIGFSSSPSVKPASWSRIWAPGATGEPGQYDANFTNALGSAETPYLVYNPDDTDGRPFWIYYHCMARDSRTSDGSTGYSTPQETRLITSATLVRDSWVFKQTVLPVRNYNVFQVLNHRGYAVVQRNSTSDWEAWHLGSDRWDHSYTRSTSTDGLNWTPDWFTTSPNYYYRRWEVQQYCPPGWRIAALEDIFTYEGQRYGIGKMDVATKHASDGWDSFRDPDQRYYVMFPISAAGLMSGTPIVIYEANGPFYDAASSAPYNDTSRLPGHDGYLQGAKCYVDGSTLHLYIKHRYKTPSYIVHATVDLTAL